MLQPFVASKGQWPCIHPKTFGKSASLALWDSVDCTCTKQLVFGVTDYGLCPSPFASLLWVASSCNAALDRAQLQTFPELSDVHCQVAPDAGRDSKCYTGMLEEIWGGRERKRAKENKAGTPNTCTNRARSCPLYLVLFYCCCYKKLDLAPCRER